jgi:hypothetical protein
MVHQYNRGKLDNENNVKDISVITIIHCFEGVLYYFIIQKIKKRNKYLPLFRSFLGTLNKRCDPFWDFAFHLTCACVYINLTVRSILQLRVVVLLKKEKDFPSKKNLRMCLCTSL